jgi:hypothetical protein
MRAEELAQLIRRRPFQPLRLHLTTGQTEVGVDPDPNTGVVDRVEYISLLHFVRAHNIDSPNAPTKGNGEA